MRNLLMTKRRQDGSTFMEMSSDILHINLCFALFLGLALSFLPLPSLSSCLHWWVFSTHTIGELYTQPLWLYMPLHLALQVILQPLSIVNLKASTELGELASKWLMPSVHTKSKRDRPGAISPLHQVIQVQYPRPTAKHQRRVKVFIQMPSGRVQATYEQSFPDF